MFYQVIEIHITIKTFTTDRSGSNNLDDHTGEQKTKRRDSDRRFHDEKEKIRASRLYAHLYTRNTKAVSEKRRMWVVLA